MTRFIAPLALAIATLASTGCNQHEIVGVEYNHYTDPVDEGDEDGETGDEDGTPDLELVPIAYCGDGNLDADEECDDGEHNADEGACTGECRINVCGDGLVFEGVEQCDEGEENGMGACSEDCQIVQ